MEDRVIPDVAVVVFARNEADRIGHCLDSVVAQGVPSDVLFSDNGSTDGTGEIAGRFAERLALRIRSVVDLGPMQHIVSTGRWALDQSDAPLLVFLAGDDSWAPDFLSMALAAIRDRPEVDVAFPTFVWDRADGERRIAPVDLLASDGRLRQGRALALPDSRELANVLYGVYRRDAFARVIDALERCGEDFGGDYAAVISLLGSSRVAAAPAAVGFRFERRGVDLVERIGISRSGDESLIGKVALYARITARVNRSLGRAVSRSTGHRAAWTVPTTFVVRAPAWVMDAARHFRKQR